MFKTARLKLTAWYLLIITVISVAFSLTLYKALASELHRFVVIQQVRLERRFPLPPPGIFVDQDLLKETENRLTLMLIFINSGIIIVSGGLSYFLAGKTLQPIKEMFDDQNRFISDSSHELRTPLTALKSSFEVSLRDKELTRGEAINVITEGLSDVNRLQSLTDRLMQLSSFGQIGNTTNFKKVKLESIINSAIHNISFQAKQKRISITFKGTNISLKGSTDHLIELFTILLDNAVKYSDKKSIVTIVTKLTDGHIKTMITDAGIGISSKDLPDIFNRFFRADTARTRTDTSGFGLGLSIAKQIVGLHHGTISVKSRPKQGSVFTVSLPRFS